jgi:hypothetical protein
MLMLFPGFSTSLENFDGSFMITKVVEISWSCSRLPIRYCCQCHLLSVVKLSPFRSSGLVPRSGVFFVVYEYELVQTARGTIKSLSTLVENILISITKFHYPSEHSPGKIFCKAVALGDPPWLLHY